MPPRHLAPNTLAFFGPGHASELTEFCYVRLRRVIAEEAVAQVVRPDSDEDGQEISVPISTFELRVVEAEEGQLWPGSYLAHPVAFVQPGGPRTGQWAYGVVLRYEVNSKGTWLSVLSGDETILVPLFEPIRIIKADPITYALQIGATVSDMTLNPKELLLQQDTVIGACCKKRGALPPSVRALLSVPFSPDERIPLIQPSTLGVVSVRRQHILDCSMGKRKKNALDLYRDTIPDRQEEAASVTSEARPSGRHFNSASSTYSSSDDADIQEVQQMNRTLGKRRRATDPSRRDHRSRLRLDDSEQDEDSDGIGAREAFRQSATQRRVTKTVLQPRFQGKSALYVLERMQQSRTASFLRLPPVCRGLLDFGFLARGLTLMHCRPADIWAQVKAQESNTSMTDFSERNLLRAAPSATSRSDISSALRTLRGFAQEFYVEDVTALIDSALTFIERYRGIADSDAVGWKLISFWVTKKFGKFRSCIVARDLNAAHEVRHEFSRMDEDLLELLDLRRSHNNGAAAPSRSQNQSSGGRGSERQRRQSSVPTEVLSALPRQGDKRLCMKYNSALGCSGDGHGGCFDSKRAHFRPQQLPDVVKAYITEKYNGVAETQNQ
ncbi:hypothetical protein DVH05_012393 [Phytophthora capsici]|nr:hypothetical protein DVH05_012393 [Phytophthora capsici]